MPMNPRTLRPSRGAPVFSEEGYTRLWCLTNKSSGNVSGVAESDTGSYAVKWWDGTTEVLDSGDPFSKAAGGGTRAFEVYPVQAGAPSGQFDGFDLSGNSLKAVRSEGVALEQSDGYTQTVYPYNYVPGAAEGGIVSNNSLSSQALDKFYDDLLAGSGSLTVSGNPGIDADDPTIATAKGYTVLGSVPPSTALLLHFDGNFDDSSPNGLTVTANGGAATSTAQSKWGGASAYFDGANDYISNASSNWQYWDQDDWTIELWLYPQLAEGYEPIVTANASLNLHGLNSDLYLNNASNGNGGIQAIGALQIGQWQHIAVVRHLGISTIYVDGTSVASGPVPYGDAATELHIGGSPTQSAYFNGYIDDLRIVRDAAIYTANFTPPAGPLGVYP